MKIKIQNLTNNGKRVTQEQARQHAMKVIGKHLTRAQWDW